MANGAQQISGASGAHHTRGGSSPHGSDWFRLLLPLLLWLPLLWLLLPLRLLLPRLRLLLLPLGRGWRLPLVLLRKARLALGAGQVTRDGGESVRDGRIPLCGHLRRTDQKSRCWSRLSHGSGHGGSWRGLGQGGGENQGASAHSRLCLKFFLGFSCEERSLRIVRLRRDETQ